jgi:transposase InsO family protein
MKTIHTSLTFDTSDIAKYRFHCLTLFYKHGLEAVQDAFGVRKSTLYDWKGVYENSGKKLSCLVPKSTRPKTTRMMVVNWRLESFIRSFRETYGNISKYKIKLFLDEYAKSLGTPSYSSSKIGKIIKRRGYFFEAKRKIRRKKPNLTPRLKRGPKESLPGYIEMDSITLYVLCKKIYFISAIDVVTKFAFCKLVPVLSSRYTKEALVDFRRLYSHKIRVVQTDNGHEFLGEFQRYLEEERLLQQFIYPRSPKINGVVERFNRTVQEEFINRCDELYFDLDTFSQKLTNYLTWYNTRRPHHSLKLETPEGYLRKFTKSPKCM